MLNPYREAIRTRGLEIQRKLAKTQKNRGPLQSHCRGQGFESPQLPHAVCARPRFLSCPEFSRAGGRLGQDALARTVSVWPNSGLGARESPAVSGPPNSVSADAP